MDVQWQKLVVTMHIPKGMYFETKQLLMLSAGTLWDGTSTSFLFICRNSSVYDEMSEWSCHSNGVNWVTSDCFLWNVMYTDLFWLVKKF